MFLEGVVFDAVNPQALGRFWQSALLGRVVTDEADAFVTLMEMSDGPALALRFHRVSEPPGEAQRLHLDLRGAAQQQQVVDRLLELGARHVDIGQGDAPWVVLADPEGNPFCVMEGRPEYAGAGSLAALPLDVADPLREQEFWRWLTGWVPLEGAGLRSLQHPSGRGPLLELCRQVRAKEPGRNRMHLEIRLEPGDDADEVATGVALRSGGELPEDWSGTGRRIFTDPSGNEFALLPPLG